jgi:uncharacterized protein (DUF2236 family)
MPPLALVTASMLPPRLRGQYGLAWGPGHAVAAAALTAAVRRTRPAWPAWLRLVPEARRAERAGPTTPAPVPAAASPAPGARAPGP